MGWVLVLVAATLEIVWASSLKYADKLLEWIGIGILIGISFIMLIRAYKTIPVAIAYTVFVGIGTLGTYIIGIILGEPFSGVQILFLILLLTGVVGLKLTTKEENNKVGGV